jgi:cellulose synthase/poly-beta-1,6-N-acetylglucosamine synthase-like glycosyltransferase
MPNEEEILTTVLDFYREREQEYPGQFRVMLVWNSPQEHPEVEARLNQLMREWPAFTAYRNFWSTSKCDNLNMAMGYLTTDMALLNDADTMVSAATMCRASMRIFEDGNDIAQSHNIHCWDDFIGRPEDGCFAMGALTTLSDGTKPINMSTQGLFRHSPFNGRGGFWRTSALQKVGFDHRIIGEDHDAAYRGFAYFGMKGVLDPNMLCMEREPPNCKALTNQRTRWETAALEMRRTFPWVFRSTHYTRFEVFLLIWSQVCWNAQMPLQQMPLQVCQMIPLAVVKGFLHKHVFGDEDASFRNMCKHEGCIAKMVINGEEVAFPMAFVVFGSLFLVMFVLYIVDASLRTLLTRYRPRAAFCIFSMFIAPFIMTPFRTYVQFWALYDYCWGNAKFICTARSSAGSTSVRPSVSDIHPADSLKKPLLHSASFSSDTATALPISASANSLVSMSEQSRSYSTSSMADMLLA